MKNYLKLESKRGYGEVELRQGTATWAHSGQRLVREEKQKERGWGARNKPAWIWEKECQRLSPQNQNGMGKGRQGMLFFLCGYFGMEDRPEIYNHKGTGGEDKSVARNVVSPMPEGGAFFFRTLGRQSMANHHGHLSLILQEIGPQAECLRLIRLFLKGKESIELAILRVKGETN